MKRGWRSFSNQELMLGSAAEVESIEEGKSSDCLPDAVSLSEYEEGLIREMEEFQSCSDMLNLARANHRRVCSPVDHSLRRESFPEYLRLSSRMGIK